MPQWIKNRPVSSAIIIVLFILVTYIQPAWEMFSNKPLIPTLAEKLGIPTMAEINLSWLQFIGIPIALLFLYAIWRESARTAVSTNQIAATQRPSQIFRVLPHSKPVEFYNSRDDFPLPKDELQSAGAIWCLFQNASKVRHQKFFDNYMVERLILVDPLSEGLALYAASYQTTEQLKADIIQLSKQLQGKISVRHYDGIVANSMIICNPTSGNGFIQVEIGFPQSGIDERPIFTVRETDNKELFISLRNAYQRVWQGSKEFAFS